MAFEGHLLLHDLSIKNFFAKRSLFRHYQNLFLAKYGNLLTGSIVEIGGEKSYEYHRFFPNASTYVCSNVGRDYDHYLDVTNMSYEDESQDNYICISVLEHVFDIRKAFTEIERTLKKGGGLLITIPFAYPYHDEVDYWRLSIDAYNKCLENFEIKAFIHLGGLFSTVVDNLRSPAKKWKTKRYMAHKTLAFMMFLAGKLLERKDGFPLGYGIYAIKK